MDDRQLHKTPEVLPAVPTFTPQTLAIASFSFAVLFIAILVFFNRRKSSSKGNALLLVGPPDAGKTSILFSLVYRQTLPTHTSMQTNTSVLTLGEEKRTIQIVDVPGHPRIRDQFNEHMADARAIAFVVDASTVSRNGAAVAEHLHHILHALTSLPPSQTLPSLVILAHKADLLKGTSTSANSSTLAINRVKTILERELEKRRVSQSGGVGVEGLGEEGERSDMGGLECGDNASGAFKFDEWEGGEVSFVGTSVKTEKASVDDEKNPGEAGLSAFEEWLEETM
ncbi:signal recognition particle receptor beta subunit-domain-containing protein [Crucibulum laeve]|uniref:Signal recognition particle receptor subunit beta n=1 Tax=Crucibulum laeve TaxID=68775 RepID=A0A5C3MAN3_9AGAR|nr:signal recognition particle receptor beta subunit-domain-containing protein [Crucibulum laeve]